MLKISFVIALSVLLLAGCSKKEQQADPIPHYKTRFIHETTGQPLKGARVDIQKLTAIPCSGWGCGGLQLEYWGQLTTDAQGYLEITEKGTFVYQPAEDSLWNPFLYENPTPPQTPRAEVQQDCFVFPTTMLGLTSQKGAFQVGVVNIEIPGGMPHFANRVYDLGTLAPDSTRETLLHLLKGVENQVTVRISYADVTTRDTTISIIPTTNEKIKITLPF